MIDTITHPKSKTIFSILIALLSSFNYTLHAQNKQDDVRQLDSLLYVSDAVEELLNYEKIHKSATLALPIAQRIGDAERIAQVYHRLGQAAYGLGQHDEAIAYLEKGLKVCPPNNTLLYAKIDIIINAVYIHLGMEEKAMAKLHELIAKLSNAPPSPGATLYLAFANQHISTLHFRSEKYDSALVYINRAEKTMLRIPEKNNYQNYKYLAAMYHSKSWIYDEMDKPDSALLYIHKAVALKKRNNDNLMYIEHIQFAEHYYDVDNQKALFHYLEAEKQMEQYKIKDVAYAGISKDMAELYEKEGELDKAKEYYAKYAKIAAAQKKQMSESADKVLSSITQEKQAAQQGSQRKLMIIVGIISILSGGLFFWFWWRRKRQREQFIGSLSEKDDAVEELNKKLHASLDEIVQLARDNDPHFWTRFQEAYPHFSEKLLQVNPDLKATELTLCAHLYLGFAAKEIAEYTFRAERTVQNNKYNLRKRLDIATEEDIAVWIRKCIDN